MSLDQAEFRAAAIAHVRKLEARYGALRWDLIHEGFEYRGRRYHLANRPRGIFAPSGLTTGALSIKTSVPRAGRARRYDDEIASEEPFFSYAYQGTDPLAHDNVALRNCLLGGLPVIYFYGVAESVYRPIVCRVIGEDQGARVFHVAPASLAAAGGVAELGEAARPPIERRYAIAEVRRRLHQDKFRSAVLGAYRARCAICRLGHDELIDAAHIVPDAERLGEAKVPNGLAMCKLHHAAFDGRLLGITPDRVVRLRRDLLEEVDGPMLEHGLRGFDGTTLVVPASRADWPDPELLEERWRLFAA